MKLFDRRYKLSIDDGKLEITQLHVEFRIAKSITKEPNKAEIKVYNLTASQRGELEKNRNRMGSLANPIKLEFEAGYKDKTSVIFSGNIRTIYSERQGADIITTFASADGIAQVRLARVSFSVKKGTGILDTVKQIAKKGDLSIGNLEKAITSASISSLGSTFPEGTTIDGSAYDELQRIVESAGFEVSMQNGVLQFKPQGKAVGGELLDLASDSGLIDSPTVEVNQDPGKPAKGEKYVRAKALIVPGLFPGRGVRLKSEGFNGDYEVVTVEYQGQLAGNDWYANLKLRSLK